MNLLVTPKSMSNQYQYDIDERTKGVAIKDLSEDPYQVNAHIQSLRRWAQSMPHIQCPTDAKFLLRFLRVSKFDHAKAQKRIDNFCTVRSSARAIPIYFKSYGINHPTVETFLNMRYLIPLGKIDSGETVVLFRHNDWDPDKFPIVNIIQMLFMCYDLLLTEEESQIFGIKNLYDLHGVNKNVIENICNPKVLKTFYVALQDSYPLRFKGQIFYSDSILFDLLIGMVLFFLNDKMKNRTTALRQDISKVKDIIPGLNKILPKEYSGDGDTLDECAERWNERFRRFYKDGHPFQSIKVDESKRPKDTLRFLATHADYKSETGQKEGTFTKFENIF